MATISPRRFEFAVAPAAAAWIGEALRKVFACSDCLPDALTRAVERLNGVR